MTLELQVYSLPVYEIFFLYSITNFTTVDIYEHATEPTVKYIQIQLWQTHFIPLGIKLTKENQLGEIYT
jgi:hypothetical protein